MKNCKGTVTYSICLRYFEGCRGAPFTLYKRGACAIGSPLRRESGTAQRYTQTMCVYTSGCEAGVDVNCNGLFVLGWACCDKALLRLCALGESCQDLRQGSLSALHKHTSVRTASTEMVDLAVINGACKRILQHATGAECVCILTPQCPTERGRDYILRYF